jgi:hypothetical protein
MTSFEEESLQETSSLDNIQLGKLPLITAETLNSQNHQFQADMSSESDEIRPLETHQWVDDDDEDDFVARQFTMGIREQFQGK